MNHHRNSPQKYLTILAIFMSLFFVGKLSYAQTWTETQDRIKENAQRIEIIDETISDLKSDYRLLYDGAKNQNDQLSNQISFANCLLGSLSVFLTILGFSLAWYINNQFGKIEKMKNIIEDTKKAIYEHSTDLYKKLKREETLSLLMRLDEVPEDIGNIIGLLLSRELERADFLYLKTPYLKIKNILPLDQIAINNYMTLLMQHFPYESLEDLDIKRDFINNIDISELNMMFSRDIKNFFDQTLKYLKNFDVSSKENKNIIKKLFYNYSHSKFIKNTEIQDYIKKKLTEYNMKTPQIVSILKEQAPTETTYTAWIDLIFT